jgi:hypothetical protein
MEKEKLKEERSTAFFSCECNIFGINNVVKFLLYMRTEVKMTPF